MKTAILNIAPGKTVDYHGEPCLVLDRPDDPQPPHTRHARHGEPPEQCEVRVAACTKRLRGGRGKDRDPGTASLPILECADCGRCCQGTDRLAQEHGERAGRIRSPPFLERGDERLGRTVVVRGGEDRDAAAIGGADPQPALSHQSEAGEALRAGPTQRAVDVTARGAGDRQHNRERVERSRAQLLRSLTQARGQARARSRVQRHPARMARTGCGSHDPGQAVENGASGPVTPGSG